MKSFRRACAGALLLTSLGALPVLAGPITGIVSFGDSLSDEGNTFAQYGYPAPAYSNGRYSNGPIWLDRLASRLGLAAPTASLNGGADYAFGGAATATPAIPGIPNGYAPLVNQAIVLLGVVPNVDTQIAAYLTNHTPNAGTLYTLWAGANDFFDGQTNPIVTADNLKAEIATLINSGAKNFLIPNLPSLGETPQGLIQSPAGRQGLDALSAGFNAELKADLDQLEADHPDVKIHRLDVFGLFQQVEANPAAYGLTNVTDPAYIPILPVGLDNPKFNAAGYLFFDYVHPTTEGGRILGDAAFTAAAPEPSSVVMLLTGCAGLLGLGRFRRGPRSLNLSGARPALLIAALLWFAAPGLAQTSIHPPTVEKALPPGADLPEGGEALSILASPATAPDAVAPAEPYFQHFKLDTTWLPGADTNGLQINDVDTSVTVAALLGEGLAPLLLTPGLGAHFWDGPGKGTVPPAPRLPSQLYDAYLEIGWQPRLAEWLFADLAVTPGVYSDFRDTTSQSFQMRGRGLAIMAFSPQCQVVLGALYVNYNRTKLLPAGGVIWNPDDDTKLQFLFPRPKFARRIGAWGGAQWWGYLAGEFGGGRWAVEQADGASDSIDYTDARALLGLEWLVPEGLGGHVEVGYVFDRRVTFTDGTRDYTPDATVLVRAGVRY